MSDTQTLALDATPAATEQPRRRPRPGERREQILQTLAAMLEQPGAERITTAALARQLGFSEAALYRHFASKAQMFEGLIDFIETSVFTLVRQITALEDSAQQADDGARRAARIVAMVLQFGERNPGMVRVMVGDALVLEHERLQQRMNLFFDKLEASLRQCLRGALQVGGDAVPTAAAQVRAAAMVDLLRGRLQRYARTGFQRQPTEQLEATLALLA
ncbi:nucleoid occlusion factor SlmA [Pulveribacter suum]|uniref:Nucleoid occlusion factor SlmA n=1 Tax=Pulveribacter suum TaxID=2116657 RepID=A0A2P1NP53_9BURK|nr:nucleoid occlusion factor SlmA [Pulveribacter suum]AVP58838.1 nucleoid occlusion factor SlmA [Pulveribacter suum]